MGKKVSRESAVAILVAEPNIKSAAAKIGVTEQTLHRWLDEPDFALQLAEAQKSVTKRVVRSITLKAEKAITTLDEIMSSPNAPTPSRVSAARCVLEFTVKAIELQEILERLEKLEATANG